MGGFVKEIEVEALVDNLSEVTDFLEENLEEAGASMKVITQVNVSAEEIFVNIASYAYEEAGGSARIRLEIGGDPPAASITFFDSGVPFDPLAHEDPDKDRAGEEDAIGGFGRFMVKKAMDEVGYEYKDGMNIFTMKKVL